MLADDFDRFDVDEEVIFDSMFPTKSDQVLSILENLESTYGEYLNQCLIDGFLELSCQVILEDSHFSTTK